MGGWMKFVKVEKWSIFVVVCWGVWCNVRGGFVVRDGWYCGDELWRKGEELWGIWNKGEMGVMVEVVGNIM